MPGESTNAPSSATTAGRLIRGLTGRRASTSFRTWLDEEQLDSATELQVQEQLQALLNPDLDEAEQAKRWKRIKAAAPGFLEKAATQPIVTSLLTAWLKKEVGLPPT